MKIVILDGYCLNPGDLSWGGIKKLGEVKIYDRTPPGKVLERSKGADILLTNKTALNRKVLENLPALKFISVMATGYDVVDVSYAKQKEIPVSNVPEYATDSVAQFTFALVLELCHHTGFHSQKVQEGKWTECPDFSLHEKPLIELAEKTMGIIGLGRIGKRTAEIANSLKMQIMAYDKISKGKNLPGVSFCKFDSVFKNSDVVSLHCPLTEETKGMINQETLSLMKSSSILINTARGKLIREEALKEALEKEVIAGAALDVLSKEPPDSDNPILSAPNCLVTPHIAWASYDSRKRLMEETFKNIEYFLNGNPRNVVSNP